MKILLKNILPNPEQPRKTFDANELQELADSIKENGVILPVSVEEAGNGMFILHDGERRVRAARLAGLLEIEATIMPCLNGTGKSKRLIRAMVANVQRSDLNPIDEANAYRKMVDELGLSQVEIGRQLGISYARVAQRMELLKLEAPIQKLVASGRISKDSRLTRALLDIPNTEARVKTAMVLAERNLSIKAGIEACTRVTGNLAAKDDVSENSIPAVHMAVKQAGTAIMRPVWDVFAQAGRVPPWLLVEISARNVCDRCGLREHASSTTCKGCALVEVLVEMVGRVK